MTKHELVKKSIESKSKSYVLGLKKLYYVDTKFIGYIIKETEHFAYSNVSHSLYVIKGTVMDPEIISVHPTCVFFEKKEDAEARIKELEG